MRACHACQTQIESVRVGRAQECPKCGADLHVCMNCRFHDNTSWRGCREPQAEPPQAKDAANFCDYFELADRSATEEGPSEAEKAKAAFEAMFKKK